MTGSSLDELAQIRPAFDQAFGTRGHDPGIVHGISQAGDFHRVSPKHPLCRAVNRIE